MSKTVDELMALADAYAAAVSIVHIAEGLSAGTENTPRKLKADAAREALRAALSEPVGDAAPLLELPEPAQVAHVTDSVMRQHEVRSYTADQMREYARKCLAAAPASTEPPKLEDSEQYRMQMAAISTAALGYWTENDNILPDYDTVPLRDVAKLYVKYDELYKARHASTETAAAEPWGPWIKHEPGAPMPVSADTEVQVNYRKLDCDAYCAGPAKDRLWPNVTEYRVAAQEPASQPAAAPVPAESRDALRLAKRVLDRVRLLVLADGGMPTPLLIEAIKAVDAVLAAPPVPVRDAGREALIEKCKRLAVDLAEAARYFNTGVEKRAFDALCTAIDRLATMPDSSGGQA